MLVEITLSDEEHNDLREFTGIEDASSALQFAVRAYLRRARGIGHDVNCDSPTVAEPCDTAMRDAIDQLRAMTIELYGNVGEIEETCDIEDETWRIIVVHVVDSGAVDDMVARFRRWHERLSEVPRELAGLVRLSLEIDGD